MNRNPLSSPYFSIVVPVYNRAELVGRTLRSCFSQAFDDFEVIVVDDGSTDESVRVVQAFDDPRLKLFCHERNRGVGPARNTAVHHALGEWVIALDSDDELLPDALSIIYGRSMESGGEIDRLQFMVQYDNGALSPDPPLQDEIWEYRDYIRWVEHCFGRRSETLPVVRRRTFYYVKYPNDRTFEGPYHLDFMIRFTARSCPDVVRLYHHDATNQLSTLNFARILRDAPTQSAGMERMLKSHGPALAELAPRFYFRQLSNLAGLQFLAGRRSKGIKYSLMFLGKNFFSVHRWIVLIVGLLGPKPLAVLMVIRRTLRPRRALNPKTVFRRNPLGGAASKGKKYVTS